MQDSTKKIGDTGEIIAIKYLQKNGYNILDTNFKFGRFGEIDIVAKNNGLTIFIEIKYRNSIKYGTPEEAITRYKLSKCRKTIDFYCKKNNINFEKIRFDAITILRGESSYKVTHYKNIEI